MKTRLCFRAYPAFLATLLASGLTGCELDSGSSGGGPGSCTDGFTFEDPSEEQYSSLTIDRDQATNPAQADLEKTLFRQFTQITKPAGTTANKESATQAYDFFSRKTEGFIGFNQSELPEYNSVRNGFDLLEAMIASGDVAPLQTARDAMVNCVREDAPGSIRVNTLKVTETEPSQKDRDTWELGVNYAHNPEPLTDPTPFGPNVARVAFTPESFVFTLYPNEAFEGVGPSSGFKQPSKLIAGFNADFEETINEQESDEEESEAGNAASVIFESFLDNTQDDRRKDRSKTDRWSWSSEQATDVFTGVANARCVRITAYYGRDNADDQVKVELDSKTCPGISSASDLENPDHTFSYSSAKTSIPQVRD
ncbi:hypothetical protein [Salicola sp. Rm-C-2C1-2]|uniref:hypothetical protein n=1 Tax=Salicola sp. Rm-C-2C1-2 TaxID=3141321 RepID=UPI0032E4544F